MTERFDDIGGGFGHEGLVIADLDVTAGVMRAVHEHGLDELRARSGDITPHDAFALGLQAGVAACRAAAQERDSDSGTGTGGEAGETAAPRLADWSALVAFADAQGYARSGGAVSRLRNGLMVSHIRRQDDPVTPLVERFWTSRLDDSGGRRRHINCINLEVALELTRELVVHRGYKEEELASTFKSVGPRSLRLLAQFLNESLGLEGDERLPE